MRYVKIFSLIAGLVVASVSLQAQTVTDVLNKYTTAMGGAEKLKAIKTQYAEGVMVMEDKGIKIPIKKWVKQGEAMRLEFEIMDTKNVQVLTQTNGWQFMPITQKLEVEEIDPAVRKLMKSQLDVSGELFDVAAKGKKVELVGKDTLNGTSVYKLKVATPEGITGFVYLDAQTFYMVKATNEVELQGQKVQLVTLLSDYKKTADGYAYPGTTQQSQMGGDVKINLTRLAINQPMADSLFVKPTPVL